MLRFLLQKTLICDNTPIVLCDNMSKEEIAVKKKERFLEKHPPLSELKVGEELVKDPKTGKITKIEKTSFTPRPRTVEEAWKAHDKAKKKYSGDIQKVEDNLLDFLKIEDPIVYNGKAIMWMLRPSNKKIRNMIPKELAKYEGKPFTDIPEDVLKQYDDKIYSIMSDLITKPKWSAEKWADESNPWLLRLFWEHITFLINMTQTEITGF